MAETSTSWERDPVSVLFDTGNRRLLERAYARRGQWQATRIANPSPELAARLVAAYGINWRGRDNAVTQSGKKLDARTRWARGWVRSLYYVNKGSHGGPGGAIEVEIGRALPVRGVIPAGRAVRVRVRRASSSSTLRQVQRKREADRIYDDDGKAAGRWATLEGRDW